MKMETLLASAAVGALLAFGGAANAATLWSNPWDGGTTFIASQNETTGGNGNFATAYDSFTLSSSSNLTGVGWTGAYFNPASQGPIASWTVTFYADDSGVPGSLIAVGNFPGTGGETFVTTASNGYPVYSYSEFFSPYPVAAGTYWLSVVPEVGFPPQWGWATSASGNGEAYQTFFGSGSTINGGGVNLAFDVYGTYDTAVPEPSTWAMMMLGFAGLGYAGFRRAKARPAIA